MILLIDSMYICSYDNYYIFNRGVMSLNSHYIGYTNKETIDNLVVFEEQNGRINIPFFEIKTTGRNLLTNLIIKKYRGNM